MGWTVSKAKPAGKKSAPTKEERRRLLVVEARENPHAFFPFEECGLILGFGANAMTALHAAGAPKAFRKMNPAMVREWIANNQELIGKIRSGEGEDE